MMDRGSLVPIAIGTSAGPLVGANPARRCLVLSADPSRTYYVSDRPDVAAGTGIAIPAASQALILDHDQVGEWMQRGLFAIAVGGAITVTLLEVICPCHDNQQPY